MTKKLPKEPTLKIIERITRTPLTQTVAELKQRLALAEAEAQAYAVALRDTENVLMATQMDLAHTQQDLIEANRTIERFTEADVVDLDAEREPERMIIARLEREVQSYRDKIVERFMKS